MKVINKIKLLTLLLCMLVASLCLSACAPELDKIKGSPVEPFGVYGEVTIDGVLSEEEWGNQNYLSKIVNIGGVDHEVSVSTIFTEKGLVVNWNVFGAPAYVNPNRDAFNNSGVEMYVTMGDAQTRLNKAWQIELFYTGEYGTTRYIHAAGAGEGYKSSNAFIDVLGGVDGEENSSSNNGYWLEAFIPWETFGETEAPDNVLIDGAILYCTDFISPRAAWVSVGDKTTDYYSFGDPQSWFRFDKDGYMLDQGIDEVWSVNMYTPGVELSGDNSENITFDLDGSWNGTNGTKTIKRRAKVTGAVYQEMTVFAPHLINPDLYEYETDPNGDATMVAFELGAGSNLYAEVMAFKGYYQLRIASPWWKAYKLSDAQAELLINPDKGLRVGAYLSGEYFTVFTDDGQGNMVQVLQVNAKESTNYKPGNTITLGLHVKTDIKIENYKVFYGDNITAIPTVINDGNGVTNGSVNVVGMIEEGALITAVPATGYALDKLVVNGQQVSGLTYTVSAYETPTLDIEVSFKLAQGAERTFNVTSGFAYTEQSAVKNVSFALISGEGVYYYGLTDENGVAKVSVPNGDYTVLSANCNNSIITIGSANEYDLALTRQVISSPVPEVLATGNELTDGASLYYDGEQVVSLDVSSPLQTEPRYYLNKGLDFDGIVYVSYTLKMEINANACTHVPIQFYGNGNSDTFYVNFGTWFGSAMYAKPLNRTQVSLKNLESVTEGGKTYTVINVIAFTEGSSAYVYYVDKNGDIVHIATIDDGNKITGISIRSADHKGGIYNSKTDEGGAWLISNIKAYDGEDALELYSELIATVTEGDATNATFEVNQEKVAFGASVKITATANDGYLISAIKVNGVPLSIVVNTDGTVEATFTHNDLTISEYVVTVEAVAASMTSAEYTVKMVNNAKIGAGPITAVPEGTVVTVKYLSAVYTVAVRDGKIALQLFTGEYTLSITNYKSTTVIVGETASENVGEVVLYYNVFNETAPSYSSSNSAKALSEIADYSAKDNTLTFKKFTRNHADFIETDIVFLSFSVIDKISPAGGHENPNDIAGTMIRMPGFAWETIYKNGSYNIRWAGPVWKEYTLSSELKTKITTTGIKFGLAITDDALYGLAEDASGNLSILGYVSRTQDNMIGRDIGRINGIGSEVGASEISGIKYSNTIPSDIQALIDAYNA